jgi:hypothetical protein
VFPEGGDPFFAELQHVYDEIGESRPENAAWPRPGELPDDREEIEGGGLFEDIVVRHFDWEVVYDAAGYLRLLDTFSGHIAMEPWQRDRLYGEIRRRLGQRARARGCAATGDRCCKWPVERTRHAFRKPNPQCASPAAGRRISHRSAPRCPVRPAR